MSTNGRRPDGERSSTSSIDAIRQSTYRTFVSQPSATHGAMRTNESAGYEGFDSNSTCCALSWLWMAHTVSSSLSLG